LNDLIKSSTNHFSVEYGNNLPSLKGNFQRLEQVMINLIQNACQALPDASKGILISTTNDNEPSNIEIIIRDEGMGIPPSLPRPTPTDVDQDNVPIPVVLTGLTQTAHPTRPGHGDVGSSSLTVTIGGDNHPTSPVEVGTSSLVVAVSGDDRPISPAALLSTPPSGQPDPFRFQPLVITGMIAPGQFIPSELLRSK